MESEINKLVSVAVMQPPRFNQFVEDKSVEHCN